MNIFAVDENPIRAAQYLCDKHVTKMIVESCQMLSDAHHFYDPDTTLSIYKAFKTAHRNHPATKWVRADTHNYAWLHAHGLALSAEFLRRYGKVHACHTLLNGPLRVLPAPFGAGVQHTPFAQCMPVEYQDADAVLAYRTYYVAEKMWFAKWAKGRPAPYWLEEVRYRAEALKEKKDGADQAATPVP